MKVNEIHLGNCIDIMKSEIDDKSIDLVITDPPYGINYSSFRTNSKKIKNDEIVLFIFNF
jgi:DNA modification methylase